MTRIPRQENPPLPIHKPTRQPLSNNIRAPPSRLRNLKLKPLQNRRSACMQLFPRDVLRIRPRRHLQVEPHHPSSFAGDYQKGAAIGLNGAFAADVGEVGPREDVHDAPDDVGRVAVHGDAEGAADAAVCAVAGLGVLSMMYPSTPLMTRGGITH